MDSNNNIEEILKNLGTEDVPVEAHQIAEQTSANFSITLTKQRPHILWSDIMKSRITKLAAAAAIIIIAALSITFLDKSVTPAYGITDLPELLRSANSLYVRAWSYFPEDTGPGQVQRRVALENWFDLENGRARTMSAAYNNVPMDTTLVLVEKVFDGEYKMTIDHLEKSVKFEKLSPFQQELFVCLSMREFKSQMLGDPGRLDEVRRVGHEVIDGVRYDIWEGEAKHHYWGHKFKVKSWIAPRTGELARMCAGSYEVEVLKRDVDIPYDIFVMEAPAGYELVNTKDTAEEPELNCGLTGYQRGDSVSTIIGFTMPDGSIILAWHSEHTNSDVSQSEIFANLVPGGSLPKLPIEIYTLMSIGGGEPITYSGRHLCHTIRNGKFYEWSIYVSQQLPPERSDFLGYQTVPRFNPPQDKAAFSVPLHNDLLIESEDQFNKWLLGAIAELNDDGRVPEDVTYERVMELAQRIRESLVE